MGHLKKITVMVENFQTLKMEKNLTIIQNGIIGDGIIETTKKTFKGFEDAKRLLDSKEKFGVLEGETTINLFPMSWKRSFDGGVEIPLTVRNCKDCLKNLKHVKVLRRYFINMKN